MRRTSRLLVVFGIGLAVLTFVLVLALTSGKDIGTKPTPTAPPNVTVVVAATDIPLGTTVTADMLSTKSVAANAARKDAFHDPSQAIGGFSRRIIPTGAQIGSDDFNPDQNTSIVPVPPGKRAIAVSVGDLTGVGRLIYPGDTVDVVITLDARAIKVVTVQPPNKSPYVYDGTADPTTVKAPILLQDIQVLSAIDQTPNTQPNGSPQPSTGPQANAQASKLIVLAVTDSQAEAILYARTIGTVDLVLRNVADAGQTSNTSGVILKTLFDTYGVLPPYLIKAIDAYVPEQP